MFTVIDPFVAIFVVMTLSGTIGLLYFVPRLYNEWSLSRAIEEAEEADEDELPNSIG